MAPRPKVPFTLHPAAKLRSNLDLPQATEVALSPDGAIAGVVTGEWGRRRLALHTLATGAVTEAIPEGPQQSFEHLTWSRDGQR
jgi:hypothetical protein